MGQTPAALQFLIIFWVGTFAGLHWGNQQDLSTESGDSTFSDTGNSPVAEAPLWLCFSITTCIPCPMPSMLEAPGLWEHCPGRSLPLTVKSTNHKHSLSEPNMLKPSPLPWGPFSKSHCPLWISKCLTSFVEMHWFVNCSETYIRESQLLHELYAPGADCTVVLQYPQSLRKIPTYGIEKGQQWSRVRDASGWLEAQVLETPQAIHLSDG